MISAQSLRLLVKLLLCFVALKPSCASVTLEERLKGYDQEITRLKRTLSTVVNAVANGKTEDDASLDKRALLDFSGGSVYTRWGRKTCGDDSTLIYEGFVGSSHIGHPGGGVNYQCLPLIPEYGSTVASGFVGTYMYGAEYQSYTFGLFPNNAHDQNVPCARCYTSTRSAVMMTPARRSCPAGWTKEYEGYLMTEYFGHAHPATFECVDANPEFVLGGAINTDGALFYFIRAVCAGLHHCPPYMANRELTCVVCSR